MKKIVALLLLAAMLSVGLCSCAVDMEDMVVTVKAFIDEVLM